MVDEKRMRNNWGEFSEWRARKGWRKLNWEEIHMSEDEYEKTLMSGKKADTWEEDPGSEDGN